jgi:hypothetical protein
MGYLADTVSFVKDANNRALIAWICGGISVLVGAGWAVLKFAWSRDSAKPLENRIVRGDHGAIVAGDGIEKNNIQQGSIGRQRL